MGKSVAAHPRLHPLGSDRSCGFAPANGAWLVESERGEGMIVWLGLSSCKLAYSLNMGIVCAISYWTMTYALASMVGKDSDLLGGMWSAVGTLFVFRGPRDDV